MIRALLFVYEREPGRWCLSLNLEGRRDLLLGPEYFGSEAQALGAAFELREQHRASGLRVKMDTAVLVADPRDGDLALYWARQGEGVAC